MADKTTESTNSIPTTYFPKDWREQGMVKFVCSKTKIESIVYGLTPLRPKNKEIFDFYLAMAEKGKADFDLEQKERIKRLKNLTEA